MWVGSGSASSVEEGGGRDGSQLTRGMVTRKEYFVNTYFIRKYGATVKGCLQRGQVVENKGVAATRFESQG